MNTLYEMIGPVFLWLLIGWFWIYLFETVGASNKITNFAVFTFVAGFGLRLALIAVNESLGIFAPKFQGDLSLGLFNFEILQKQDILGTLWHPFAGQVVWNLPAWTLFGPSRMALLTSNAAAGALVGPTVAVLVCSAIGVRSSAQLAVLLSVSLSCINFSIFGLRDPLIMLAAAILAASIVRCFIHGGTRANIITLLGSSACIIWLRPELAYVILCVLLLPIGDKYLNAVEKAANSQRYMRLTIALTIPIVLVTGVAAVVALKVAASNINAASANPMHIAGEESDRRFARHSGGPFGGGSHLAGGATYSNLPVHIRVPIQVVGLVVLPFPWQVRSPARLFAFMDSIMLLGMIAATMWCLFSKRKRQIIPHKAWRVSFWLLCLFAIGILGMGLIVSNAGNGFRMRIAVLPFLYVATGVILPYLRQKSAQPYTAYSAAETDSNRLSPAPNKFSNQLECS